MRAGIKLLAIAAAQTAALLAMIADRQWVLATGTPVVLAVAPVDPRSLFQGDYVVLDYDAATVGLDAAADLPEPGERVYVELAPGGDVWHAVALRRERIDDARRVQIRGTVEGVRNACAAGAPAPCATVHVRFGIESYFVPEGTGHRLEALRDARRMSVEVAVGRDGRAGIAALLVDGKVVHREGLF